MIMDWFVINTILNNLQHSAILMSFTPSPKCCGYELLSMLICSSALSSSVIRLIIVVRNRKYTTEMPTAERKKYLIVNFLYS